MTASVWRTVRIETDDGTLVEAKAPVILSASRCTDIPAFFMPWFMNRLRRGYVRRVNPFSRAIEYVSFVDVRAIVFWSKNPAPLLSCLKELDARGVSYYVQYTLNDYEEEGLEPGLPPLAARIETFRALSGRLGAKRVVWRFDPLLLAGGLTVERLMDRVAAVGEALRARTERLVVSFADIQGYRKVAANLARERIAYCEFTPELMHRAAVRLQALGRALGLTVATCAESIDLAAYGIEHNRCIDDRLLAEAFPGDRALMEFLGGGRPMKDKGQRKACGCIVSKDIGSYDTCSHHCAYCYANTSRSAVARNLRAHRADSEALAG